MNIKRRKLIFHNKKHSVQIKVGLVQIGDRFENAYYFPYSVGLLQEYAKKKLSNPEDFYFLPLIYKRIKVDNAVDDLLDADIVFFSVYAWNFRISLEIAKRLKDKKSICTIVFGGPQVPESIEKMKQFLGAWRFIDIGCYGEGEVPFLEILRNIKEAAWGKVPAIAFLDKEKNFMYNQPGARIENLNDIPSPYLEGSFDSLIRLNPDDRWLGLLETNRGCPHCCAFCYWGKKSKNKINKYSLERVYKELDWISKNNIPFVFCCDANFGILERDIDIASKVAENKRKYGYPLTFSVQNTKNSNHRIFALQKVFNDMKLQKGVNLALQSLNADTLASINRVNVGLSLYKDLQAKFTVENIQTFTDLILGLPNETYDTFTDGVSALIKNGQHNRIQFLSLIILENTEMATFEYQEKYGLITIPFELIQHHTSLAQVPEVIETQQLVIGTSAMCKEDWLKGKIFGWMVSLLYFNKLLQIPFILIYNIANVDYRESVEFFMEGAKKHPLFFEIFTFFKSKAENIQKGGGEYVPSDKWLNIWWPADEYMFIYLCIEKGLDKFYKEAILLIDAILKAKKISLSIDLIQDMINFNKSLIKLPFIKDDILLELNYNIPEMYKAALGGAQARIKKGKFKYIINTTDNSWTSINEWLKEVVWLGTKKGAYLYDIE